MSLLHTRRLLTYALLFFSLAAPATAQVSRIRNSTATTNPPPGDAGRGDVRRASCVLQIDYDANRGNRTFDVQTLNALLTSTALVDPAAEKTLGLSSDQWPRVVQIEVVPAGNSAVRLGVTIAPDAQTKIPADAARLLLGELAARAKVAVDAAGTRQEKGRAERVAALEADLAAAMKELDKASGKLREAKFAGEGERTTSYQLQSRFDRDSLEITLRSQEARLVTLEAERQRLNAAAATRPERGAPQLSPWPDLIAAREKIVAVLREKKAAGTGTELELLEAEASLAEARALATLGRFDRRELDPAERWQQEVVSLKASIAENEARLAAINERFPKPSTTQPSVPLVDVEQLRQDEAMARNRVNEIRQSVEQFRRDSRNAASAATLIILDGKSGS